MSIFNSGSESKEESRRTIIAVVISTIIVGVGFTVQNLLFPPPAQTAPTAQVQTTTAAPNGQVTPAETPVTVTPWAASPVAPAAGTASAAATATAAAAATAVAEVPAQASTYTVETDLLTAVFSNAGGDLVSLALKAHKDKTGQVDLIVPGSDGSRGFSLAFGGATTPPVSELMNATWLDEARKTIQFSRTFYVADPKTGASVPFTYRKTFTFRDGEYMFGMAVGLENSTGSALPLDKDGYAYTISIGPQIGPRFDHLPKNADYRKYILEINGKKKIETAKAGSLQVIKDQPSWASIAGKYFAFIAVPESLRPSFSYLQGQDSAIRQTNTMYISRPVSQASSQTDTYYFYFGPKTTAELAKYEYADKNAYGLASLKLEDATERSNMLGWLESILKFFLNIFYKVIPNYGVAIILVTILIKILFFPLTKKGSISTARTQELQPKLQELQAKYKGNPQKLNQEMAEFYKRENFNPMSGCLPMLIQFPLFIAMYNLFNNHFDLRGASFIPGWIGDLSLPETIWNFGAFRLPLLGWNDLRALPIIYLASQLLYGKFTQTAQTGQSANQMKFMMYGMPIMFFFMLYDVPSGLLLYWIISNLLTIVQQIIINDMLKKHKLKVAAEPVMAQSGSGGAANAKSAGRTTVRSDTQTSRASGGSMSDKVKNWLEKKAADAQKAAGNSGNSGKSGKNSGKSK